MFTKEFKPAEVQRLERGSSVGEVAQQRWAEGRIAALERKIGQQALEIDF